MITWDQLLGAQNGWTETGNFAVASCACFTRSGLIGESSLEVRMNEQWTCGMGLAANAALPAKMARFLGDLAGTLEAHMESLLLDDENAALEHDAYASLVGQYRDVASRLAAVAREMSGYRDLPMGKHDERVLTRAEAMAPFQSYVRTERELLDLLNARYPSDRRMLQDAGLDITG